MAGLTLETAPASEPIDLAAAKQQLNIVDDDDNDVIETAIAAARSTTEAFLKQSLLTTGWTYRIDGAFPWEIRLPIGPVLDAENLSITYIDTDGSSATLETDVYQVSLGETGVIRPAYGRTWPATQPVMDAVTVSFEAGYPDAGSIPKAIRQAMLMTIGDFFAHRENIVVGTITAEIPIAARNLLMPFVRHD